ncbi:MAG TPA: glycosyltransferase family 9 protein [Chloroflexota bacterium]|nr:glycosyltransferase family 9 protein [Chloroflexota bacterium]
MPSASRSSLRRGLLRLAGRLLLPRRVQASSTSASPKKVLLLRPDHIGDVLLTSPAIALLRASLPAAELTYVVGPWSADAARYGPSVDSLRTLSYPGFTRRPNASLLAPYSQLLREALRLRREAYDVAIVFRPDHWWGALLALAAAIPVRVGVATPETTPLLTHALPDSAGCHASERALDLARLALSAFGATTVSTPRAASLVFRVPPDAIEQAKRSWQEHSLTGRTVVALQPNAGMPLKSWPTDRWAELADALTERDIAVVLVGAPDDAVVLRQIQSRAHQVITFTDQPLAISAAIYARCTVLVAPDSGAAHLAAACGTPTVRLYGPAPPAVFGPWPPGPDQRVLLSDALPCISCGHLVDPPCGATRLPACLLAVGVDDVLNAIETLLPQG